MLTAKAAVISAVFAKVKSCQQTKRATKVYVFEHYEMMPKEMNPVQSDAIPIYCSIMT